MINLASELQKLPEEKRKEYYESLSSREVDKLLYDWSLWARKEQIPPEDWFIWLILTGRGWGKNRTGSELIKKWAWEKHSPIALVGQNKGDVRDTMVEVGDSSILKTSPPWFYPKYEPSKRRLTWPNGVVGIIYSGDEPDQLRGPQHSKAWVDELAKYQYPQETWSNLMMGLRVGAGPQVLVTTTPRPIKIIKDLVKDSLSKKKRMVVTRGHTLDNKDNLSPDFLKHIIDKYEGTRLGRQELAGEVLDSTEGLVYDSFQPASCVIPRFAIPTDWSCFTGHDFGLNNTACVWYAQDPQTGFFYLYRTYHRGGSTVEHAQNFRELSASENIVRRVGGSHTEEGWRGDYTSQGWPISEPIMRKVENQIDRVWTFHKQNRIYVFADLQEYLDEKMSLSWEINDDDEVTQKIHNESQFHLMAGERYIISDFPLETVGVGSACMVDRR